MAKLLDNITVSMTFDSKKTLENLKKEIESQELLGSQYRYTISEFLEFLVIEIEKE